MADFPVVLDAATLNGTNGFTILAPDGTGGIEVRHIRGSIPGELTREDDPSFFSHPTNNLVITAFRYGTDFAGRPVTEVGAVQFIAGRNSFGQPADFPALVGTFSTGGPPQAPRKDGAEAAPSIAAAEEPAVSPIVAGIDKYDITGFSAASAGDVNGDGFQDFMISAPGADPDGNEDSPVMPAAGVTYVVFGSDGTGAAGTGFAGLDGSNGFRIDGAAAYDTSGWSVDGIGDFNGDGFDDMLIGANRAAPGGDFFAGASYVVFGSGDPFAASMSLADLDGANGFRIDGLDANDGTGASVAGAGDINGDGFADLIVGAAGGDPDGRSNAGESYVVFGSDTPFDASLDLAALDGVNGFRIDGAATGDRSGQSVAAAGDVNGDGFGDLIVGAYNVDVDGDRGEGFSYQGAAYVVFGSGAPFAADLDLADLDGTDGFRMRGDAEDGTAQTGYSVASAGDVNGDGFDDLIVGAVRARTNPNEPPSGAAYVLFGSADPFDADFDLTTLDGSNGFRVNAADTLDYLGSSVSSAGDINGDGFDDVAISARGTEEAYVIFGRAPSTAVTRTGSKADQTIMGGDFNDVLNGLGGNDVLEGGLGRDRLSGGVGSDTAAYVFAGAGVTVRLARTTGQDTIGAGVDRLASLENAAGSAFADALTGTVGANRLDGGGGRDSLLGGGGNDRLFGDGGNDVLNGAAGRDRLDGGTGIDVVNYAWTGSAVTVSLARTTAQDTRGAGVDTLASIENAVGSAFADVFTGTAGANRLDGAGGNDRLAGGRGNDRLFGANGDDRVGGGDGADTLTGGSGIDRLTGGRQRDTMTGGADADMFLFDDGDTGASRAAADRITDFSHAGGDCINLRAIDADTGTSGDQNFAFIGTGAFTDVAGQLRYEVVDGNAFVQGDINGDGTADFFIRLDNVQIVDAADFVI